MSNDTDAINTINQSFAAAVGRGDAAAMAAVYATNGQILPPNHEIVEDPRNIEAYWQGALDGGLKAAHLESVELTVDGDRAVEVGRYQLQGADDALMDRGRYVVLWTKEGGQWRWRVDIFNSGMPV